jgi:soluble lytic murein transglycosylase-like protein
MAAREERNRRTGDVADSGRTDGAGTQTERRASDRRAGDRRRGEDRRGRNLLQKYRQPLIGLGLAGMALPLVRATSAQDEAGKQSPSADDQPADETAAMAGAEDTEEALAEQIALSREEQERETAVEAAVERYNIARDLAEDIYDIALESNIDPKLAYGLIKTESTFNERAVSPVGARGLTQVMPRTAAWLVPGTRTQDLYDRQTNLRLGFKYLDQMIDKYKGDVRLALLAYNRGPGTVDGVLRRGGNPDNGYADKVLRG